MEAQQYRKLWWDIILATVCFAVVPLFILGGVIYHQFSVSYTAKIMENMKTLAENRASSVDLFLEERISQLTGLANTQSLGQLQNEDYLNRVFNIIQTRSKSFLDLGVIDEDGNHLAYVGPHYSILKKVNYKDETWFHEVMATGVYVSDVFLGFRKIPHFIIAVMVREKNQSWVLRATIDSDIIDNIVRAAWIGKKGDAFIINRENVLQTTPRFGGKVMEPPKAPDFAAATGTMVEEMDFRRRDFSLCHQHHQTEKVGPGHPGSPYRGTDPAAAGQISGGVNRPGGRGAHHHRGLLHHPGDDEGTDADGTEKSRQR